MRKSLILLPMILAACATTASGEDPTAPGGGATCKSEGLDAYIGKPVTAERGAEALRKSGARTLRWIPEGSAVTMDFRQDRLNIGYDRGNAITTINCG